MRDLMQDDTDPEPASLIETGYVQSTGEMIWRTKKPIGTYKEQDIWLIHVRKMETIEENMGKESKILTWKQAKLDKEKAKIDFDENALGIVVGGGTPVHLEWQNTDVDLTDPIVEKIKDKDGLIVDVKEKDKEKE